MKKNLNELIEGMRKYDCDIKVPHVHVYVSKDGYKKKVHSENMIVDGYYRTDEYYMYTHDQEDLIRLIAKNDLLFASDNIDLIKYEMQKNTDYVEYEYKEIHMQPIIIGKVTSVMPRTDYYWTTESEGYDFTGEKRICHHEYQAYKIVKKSNGKYKIAESPYVDDLTSIIDEYPFIKRKYGKIFYYEYTNDLDNENKRSR